MFCAATSTLAGKKERKTLVFPGSLTDFTDRYEVTEIKLAAYRAFENISDHRGFTKIYMG